MRRLCCVILGLVCVCSAAWAETQFKMITLQHRFGQDLLPAIQPLVGADGTASAIDNQLLIQASPERMATIEQAVAALDTEVRTWRIRVDRSRAGHASGSRLEANGSVSRGDVRIQGPGRNRPGGSGVTVEMERRDSSTSEQIAVLDGAQAVIAVGQSIPFTEHWLTLARRYADLRQTVQYRDITTGFSVRPRLIGQEVELEIVPRLASLRSDGVIEFAELGSTVRVVPGLWFDLGAAMHVHDEVSQAILTRTRKNDGQNIQLWIMVE